MNTTTQTWCIVIVEFKLLGLLDMWTVLLNLCIWLYPTIPSPYPLRGEERENASLRISSSGPPTLSLFLSSGVLESCNPHYHIRARSLLSLSLSPALSYDSISLWFRFNISSIVQRGVFSSESHFLDHVLAAPYPSTLPSEDLNEAEWKGTCVVILKIYRRWF